MTLRTLLRPLVQPLPGVMAVQAYRGDSASVIALAANGVLAPGFVFTRAGAGATVTDAAGIISPVAADIPRWPGAGARLLVEGARTNVCLQSQTLNVAPWSGTALTAQAPASGFSPSGANDAFLLATVANGRLGNAIGCPADTLTRTASFYLKAGTAPITDIRLLCGPDTYARITWATNTIAPFSGTHAVPPTLTPVGNGWYRATVSVTNTSQTSLTIYIFPAGSTAGGSGDVLAWGVQVEEGTFATTYIPTVASAVTRAIDAASITLAAAGLAGLPGFTLSGRVMIPQNAPVGAGQGLIYVDAGDSNVDAVILYNLSNTPTIALRRHKASVANQATLGSMIAGTTFGWALAINLAAGTASACMEGQAVQTVSGGPTSLTTLRIGNSSLNTQVLSGTISAYVRRFIVPNTDLPGIAASVP